MGQRVLKGIKLLLLVVFLPAQAFAGADAINGFLDGISPSSGDGTPQITGWACNKNHAVSIPVDLWVGNSLGPVTHITTVTANDSSEDAVADACNVAHGGSYRYHIPMADVVKNHPGDVIWIYGVSQVGGEINGELANSHTMHVSILPPGWVFINTSTYPAQPSTDFGFPNAPDYYPVCGPGRVALSGDGNYDWTSFSSSGKPRSNLPADVYPDSPSSTLTYLYTSTVTPDIPVYAYPPQSRCYCLNTNHTGNLPDNVGVTGVYTQYNPLLNDNATLRQSPVTYDVINSQKQDASVAYGPVPIAKDANADGRNYGIFSAGNSNCGCPNVNESASANLPGDPSIQGTTCRPMIVDPTNRVLATFDPVLHQNQIMSSAWEVIDNVTGNVSSIIQLPVSGANQSTTTEYNRKIWTCAAPYELDTHAKTCTFKATHHGCDDGTQPGSFISPVNDLISGAQATGERFNNTVNRKLACCLNAFHSDGKDPYEKFDCIDNSANGLYASFDALWASSDGALDGEQMNAMVLSNGNTVNPGGGVSPKILTGFYTMDGRHCDQFSEFAYPAGSTIKHYQVSTDNQGRLTAALPVAFGTDIPLPASPNYTLINSKIVNAWNKTYPQSAADYLACPLLVRAATVVTCPPETTTPTALSSVPLSQDATARCAVAGAIQVQVRIEQVFKANNSPAFNTVDTTINLGQNTSADVAKLIADKTGNQCPPFTHKVGETGCAY